METINAILTMMIQFIATICDAYVKIDVYSHDLRHKEFEWSNDNSRVWYLTPDNKVMVSINDYPDEGEILEYKECTSFDIVSSIISSYLFFESLKKQREERLKNINIINDDDDEE